MKISFVAVNSKYVHTSLSVRYLKTYAEKRGLPAELSLCEYTVNARPEDTLGDLYRQKADVYCFSTYIFNRAYILPLLSSLRKLCPDAVFILGGPEASSDDEALLRSYPCVDFISLGEGEKVLSDLLLLICQTSSAEKAKTVIAEKGASGVSFIREGEFYRYPNVTPVCDLDEIPFPYTEDELKAESGRIVYWETSRGCPFFCTYCCSGREEGVRSFSMERIYSDIDRLMSCGLRQVKLVDRTFNYNRKRTLDILRYIARHHNGVTNFHLEIAPWLIDGEFLDLMATLPTDIFRFEAGIQTTNPDTLRAINRFVDLDVYRADLQKLIDMGFCVHLDLIAGLPYEDIESFGRSYNDVISLGAEELQLGFLKVLKGTALAEDTLHGIVCSDEPPYAILYNRYVTFDDLELLRKIERLTDRYYNGFIARRALKEGAELLFCGDTFAFMKGLSEHFDKNGLFEGEWSLPSLYESLSEYINSFASEAADRVLYALALDYFSYGKSGALPSWLKDFAVCNKALHTDVLKNDGPLKYLMTCKQREVYASMEPKKWFRNSETVMFCGKRVPADKRGTRLFFLYGQGLGRRDNCVFMGKSLL